MAIDHTAVIAQIDSALAAWEEFRARAAYDDLSDLKADLPELVAILADVVHRFSPPGSVYRYQLEAMRERHGTGELHYQVQVLRGTAKALRRAYVTGALVGVQQLVHASMFADFHDMAEYLLADGYKDAAAVIGGSILEENMRNLCAKHGVTTTDAKGYPKKASVMNDDLAKCVYDKLQQKSVTAWLDLRNKAAHGDYGAYDSKQVELLLHGVRDFLLRYPA